MNSLVAAFKRQAGYLKRYPTTVLLIALCCDIILYSSWQEHKLHHAISYIAAAWLCCLVTDIVVLARPIRPITEFPIKKPAGKELMVILICTMLGTVFLFFRFFTDWAHTQGWIKLLLLPLVLFCFQIVTATIFIFRYKYRLRDFGINLHYWYLPVFLHIIWGGATLLAAPQQVHFTEAYKEYGPLGLLFTGIISAALPEEFLRMLLQTRAGKVFRNIPMGMVLSTAIWGAMHIPVGYGQSHTPVTLWSAVQAIAFLMPIGIFWGYITQRTRSLFPALMMHGFNLWGLQNF